MSLYAAIDLHSTNSVLAVMDQAGKPLLQCRRASDLPVLLADLAPFQRELASVAVESTYNWYWLVDGLMDEGYRVHLVNTAAIPQYAGLKHGNDHTDALHLAQLMRLGLLPEGYIYPRGKKRGRGKLTAMAGSPHLISHVPFIFVDGHRGNRRVFGQQRAATSAPTRTVTGALLAPNRTQRTAGLKRPGIPHPATRGRRAVCLLTPAAKW